MSESPNLWTACSKAAIGADEVSSCGSASVDGLKPGGGTTRRLGGGGTSGDATVVSGSDWGILIS